MSFTVKPNPEGYMAQITAAQRTRGLLRVYLGYAAGTGKTYAMLSAAKVLLAEGEDVVVGLVETHGREATEAMLQGLPSLPRKTLEYRGRSLTELDLDAALERKPKVLLVDELAHSNIGEGRHPKRWGDVQELLEAGIEVHTTLNVQHLESVADVVAGITGVAVQEVVPDSVLEEAEEIVLIDLPPDALLERLDAGKVYKSDQAPRAREGFFQKTHLLALRELAMRKAAHHVDEDARDYLRQNSLAGPWAAGERLLVCVGPSPYSETLVRATKRLADAMSATWVALHVDTGSLTPAEHERVDRHLQLAQRLGAEVLTQTSHSLIDQVLETASSKNVTKVVTGRTPGRTLWSSLFRPSLADSVLRAGQGLDVLVLGSADPGAAAVPVARDPTRAKSYFAAVVGVGLATALGLPLADLLNPTIQAMMYLAAVVGSAYRHGSGPSVLASVLSIVCLNFFFVEPVHSLNVDQPTYYLAFFGLLLNGLLVSKLTASVKQQSRSAQLREADALTLLALSRDLAHGTSLEELARVAEGHLTRSFGPSRVLLADKEGRLEPCDNLESRELAVADRALRSGSPTGKGTDTLPGADHQWHPLAGPLTSQGVAGLVHPVALGARRREDLLEAILNQVSAALERRRLSEAAQRAELLQASEKLHSVLLNSVSHDLRIPLVSIQGALTTLKDNPTLLDDGRREAVLSNALSETERLNRLVGNLLHKTRLQTGHLTLRLLPCDVEDLLSTTVSSMRQRLEGRPITIEVDDDLPLVPMDFVLVGQVVTNLLENAVAYSEPGTPISLEARCAQNHVRIEVSDRGAGLGSGDSGRLFEKFERGTVQHGPTGIGLGLSICRGLVEAHHGSIWGANREGGGAVFTFTLPLEVRDVENR